MNISRRLAAELGLKAEQVERTIGLIDEGNTIPFISRYRKEITGGLSDEVLRTLDDRLKYMRALDERKAEVLRLIDEQGKLTPEIEAEIAKAEVLQRVEDIYKPYKKKRATRASKAKERGLEPLAEIILSQKDRNGDPLAIAAAYVNPEKEVPDAEAALAGACDIIAEMISDDADLIGEIRERTMRSAVLETKAADPKAESPYEMYYEASEGVAKIPNHRILAVNRGEKEKFLNVKVVTDVEAMERAISRKYISRKGSIYEDLMAATVTDAYKRLIAPSVEREVRAALTERAEEEAIKIFGENTRNLLMAQPVKGARIISIDPGYRTGCKVAVLDETGKLLEYTTIYPTKPREDIIGTKNTLFKLARKHAINTIVIGNGTGSRETEEVVADFIRESGLELRYTIVNEAGASVYSASKLASEEYPELDVTTRGAMSLGRRLQDPLAELVKIDPKSIGVGQYQHDMNQGKLEHTLGNVVEDCVNSVGVDLNTASPSLLSYISGINMGIAKNIVAYREEKGTFTDRRELLKVAKLGPKAYTQCAGFLRIAGGRNPLDNTSVHPESYEVAEKVIEKAGLKMSELTGGVSDIEARLGKAMGGRLSVSQLAEELGVGALTLKDIIAEIRKPARDPREDAPQVVFRNDVRSFEDLEEGMELTGTVRNVVDFGAFVDIGVKHDGLVHISQLSDKYIKHPMDVVAVGDTVKVKIISIDKAKQRVGLTMKGL
ncbi:MAG: RNA-binding transcriptional accessory protein [Clostridiales bacterium]|nr:RNA-binding transcriptional accessory protein [Candidatus Crickella merdequi]